VSGNVAKNSISTSVNHIEPHLELLMQNRAKIQRICLGWYMIRNHRMTI